mmetsp:Transcript_16148/g.30653  ORF Transcript_16148/g.30653 Transcript_16148/m.30653 type:complete len:265 (+) Transcript_16148:140-934(+)
MHAFASCLPPYMHVAQQAPVRPAIYGFCTPYRVRHGSDAKGLCSFHFNLLCDRRLPYVTSFMSYLLHLRGSNVVESREDLTGVSGLKSGSSGSSRGDTGEDSAAAGRLGNRLLGLSIGSHAIKLVLGRAKDVESNPGKDRYTKENNLAKTAIAGGLLKLSKVGSNLLGAGLDSNLVHGTADHAGRQGGRASAEGGAAHHRGRKLRGAEGTEANGTNKTDKGNSRDSQDSLLKLGVRLLGAVDLSVRDVKVDVRHRFEKVYVGCA